MEFDAMKKVWDTQNNTMLYAIDEHALTQVIARKKNQAGHLTNITELLLIVVNVTSGAFIAWVNFTSNKQHLALTILAGWMIATALYVFLRRLRRLYHTPRFDRSMQGDLSHALALATYQVNISHLMRWNVVPVAVLIVAGTWSKSPWLSIATTVFFLLTFYASRWEHNVYKTKKLQLENLKRNLDEETAPTITR